MLRERTRREWVAWVSGKQPEPAAGWEERRWVYSPGTIDILRRRIRSEKLNDSRRALHFLHALLVGDNIRDAVTDLDRRALAIRLGDVEFDGESMPFRDLQARLGREPDPLQRRRLTEASLPLLAELNPILEERERQMNRAAALLGYGDAIAVASEIRRYDLKRAGKLAEAILASSDAVYLSALRELMPAAVDVRFERLRPADVPRLRHSSRYAHYFPADGILPAINATLEELGIVLEDLPVRVDSRDLPRKNPRAACFPVIVPQDIRLSIKPTGGVVDYALLLHEMGHALQFVYTRTPVFEFQQLGDNSVAEAYAFLIEGLADEPAWLHDRLGLDEPMLTDYVRLAALKRLFMVRRYAGRLLFELEWRGGEHRRGRAIYRRHMSRAYGFTLEDADVERYLIDQDDFFYSADYVRGWVLAAQLRSFLRRRFGGPWWRNPEAGKTLRELWSAGQHDTADELAGRLQFGELAPEPLVKWAAMALLRGSSHAAVRP